MEVDILHHPLYWEIVLVHDRRIRASSEEVRLKILVRNSSHDCEPLVSATFVDGENEYHVFYFLSPIGICQLLSRPKCS